MFQVYITNLFESIRNYHKNVFKKSNGLESPDMKHQAKFIENLTLTLFCCTTAQYITRFLKKKNHLKFWACLKVTAAANIKRQKIHAAKKLIIKRRHGQNVFTMNTHCDWNYLCQVIFPEKYSKGEILFGKISHVNGKTCLHLILPVKPPTKFLQLEVVLPMGSLHTLILYIKIRIGIKHFSVYYFEQSNNLRHQTQLCSWNCNIALN